MRRNKILVLCLNNKTKIDKNITDLANDFEGIIYIASDDGSASSVPHKSVDALIARPYCTDPNGIISAVRTHTKMFSGVAEQLDITVCGNMNLIDIAVYCIALQSSFQGSKVNFYSQTCPDFGTPEAKAGLVVCSKLGINLPSFNV